MKRSIAYLSTALLLAGTSLAFAQTQNPNATSKQSPGMSQNYGSSATGAQQAPGNASGATSNSNQSSNSMSNGNSSANPSSAAMSNQGNQQSSANRSNSGVNSRQEIQQVQQALDQKGGQHLRTDGILGPRTREALRDYQHKNGLQASGQLDQQTLQKLNVAGR